MALNVSVIGTDLLFTYTLSEAGQPVNAATATASVVRPDGRTDGPFDMAHPVTGTYTYIYSPPRLTGENLFTAYVTTTNPNTAAKGEFIVQI